LSHICRLLCRSVQIIASIPSTLRPAINVDRLDISSSVGLPHDTLRHLHEMGTRRCGLQPTEEKEHASFEVLPSCPPRKFRSCAATASPAQQPKYSASSWYPYRVIYPPRGRRLRMPASMLLRGHSTALQVPRELLGLNVPVSVMLLSRPRASIGLGHHMRDPGRHRRLRRPSKSESPRSSL
jgi:hypothetical protein